MNNFIEIYERYKLEQGLNDDPVQNEVVSLLNNLFLSFTTPAKKSWFTSQKILKGLYIWGGVGRGKTMLMDLFFDSLPGKDKRRVHFNIFMLDVHSAIKILREDGKGQNPLEHIAHDIAKDVRILCFDEFQVYDIADAMVLSELFKALFKKGVTVIATSNVAPDDLYKDGLQRSRFMPFIPLLKKHMHIFYLDSPTDYRQQALRENGVYFIQNKSVMEKLFQKMVFPGKAIASDLKIKKRRLHIKKAVAEIAWVDFSELCEKPRGTNDYKTLSETYQTIFIDNVPRMGYDRRNEAKRFILLVDTFYDAQIRLVLNAECMPADIYQGKDHSFEFERTISRLLEMQGEEYLSKTEHVKIDKN